MSGSGADGAPRERRAVDVDALVRALASRRQDLHQFIVDTVAEAVSARRALLAAVDPAGETLTVTATRGSPAPCAVGSVMAAGAGVTGRTFATRRPRLVPDTAGDPGELWLSFRGGSRSTPGRGGAGPRGRELRLPLRGGSCISAPLVARGSALGAVTVADPAGGRPFDRADLAVVERLAATAALALACERLVEVNARLERAAAVDPLTGLLNRGGLDARLRDALERGRRRREPVAMVAIDVDRFKSLNDALGHRGGDAVLQGLASIFRRSVRAFDHCARFGGDEFAIVMPRAAAAAARRRAERIRRRVENYWPEAVARPAGLRITASFGVAVARPAAAAEIVDRADRALYAAKAHGRNRVHPPARR